MYTNDVIFVRPQWQATFLQFYNEHLFFLFFEEEKDESDWGFRVNSICFREIFSEMPSGFYCEGTRWRLKLSMGSTIGGTAAKVAYASSLIE